MGNSAIWAGMLECWRNGEASSLAVSASANQRDDFDPVSIGQNMVDVLSLGNEFLIDFDGHKLAGQIEFFEQSGHGCPVSQITLVAVDDQFHSQNRSKKEFSPNWAKRGSTRPSFYEAVAGMVKEGR